MQTSAFAYLQCKCRGALTAGADSCVVISLIRDDDWLRPTRHGIKHQVIYSLLNQVICLLLNAVGIKHQVVYSLLNQVIYLLLNVVGLKHQLFTYF